MRFGDVQQLLDHLGVDAMEGERVHLHAQGTRASTPDSVLHQDVQHFFFLEKEKKKNEAELEAVEGGGERGGRRKKCAGL